MAECESTVIFPLPNWRRLLYWGVIAGVPALTLDLSWLLRGVISGILGVAFLSWLYEDASLRRQLVKAGCYARGTGFWNDLDNLCGSVGALGMFVLSLYCFARGGAAVGDRSYAMAIMLFFVSIIAFLEAFVLDPIERERGKKMVDG